MQVFSVNFAEFLRTPFLKTSPVASTENKHNKTKQKFSLNDSLWVVLATCQNGHVLTYFFAADKKLKWDKTKRKISYLYSFKKGNFPLEGGAIVPNVFPQLRHCISRNCILLSHPHYIHHTKYMQKADKPMIYVMIGSEADVRELIW